MNIETFKSLPLQDIIEIAKQPLYMVYKTNKAVSKEKVMLSEFEDRDYAIFDMIQTNVLTYKQISIEGINLTDNDLTFYDMPIDTDEYAEYKSFDDILYLAPNEGEAKSFIDLYNTNNTPIIEKEKYGWYYLEGRFTTGCETCGTLKYGDWELIQSQSNFRID